MTDDDKSLTHLFVRDLDTVELPPREAWRGVPRKEPYVMKISRYVLYAGSIAALLIVVLVAALATRSGDQGASGPSLSPGPTKTSIPSGASVSPSPSPTPTAARFVSALGYAVVLPNGWRRSDRLSRIDASTTPTGIEVFTRRTVEDEAQVLSQATETQNAAFAFTAQIRVDANPDRLDAMAWARSNRVAHEPNEIITPMTVSGRPAARVSYPGSFLWVLYVESGTRMYALRPVFEAWGAMPMTFRPAGTTEADVLAILDSFSFTP